MKFASLALTVFLSANSLVSLASDCRQEYKEWTPVAAKESEKKNKINSVIFGTVTTALPTIAAVLIAGPMGLFVPGAGIYLMGGNATGEEYRNLDCRDLSAHHRSTLAVEWSYKDINNQYVPCGLKKTYKKLLDRKIEAVIALLNEEHKDSPRKLRDVLIQDQEKKLKKELQLDLLWAIQAEIKNATERGILCQNERPADIKEMRTIIEASL